MRCGARSNLSPNRWGYHESMKVAIVGFATEGKVSASYWAALGYDVTVCDQDAELDVPLQYARKLGKDYLLGLDRFDVVVRSAGIHPGKLLADNPTIEPKITTAINEFLRACPTKNTIGITGTKGKGTTSTLTAKMLEAAGKKVWLGGNIGRSPLEFINEIKPDDWVVLELSSFQLIDIKQSTHIAVCLMVTPEHLNWHADMADYTTAKKRLFMQQQSDDTAIYYAENEVSKQIAASGPAATFAYYAAPMARVEKTSIVIENLAVCDTSELPLLGAHNWQNVCAALTIAWQAGVHDLTAIRSVLTRFSGLNHRLEFVSEVEGVKYYDDSFGTTPETAIVALRAFKAPKVVILGGSDKGADYSELAEAVAFSKIRKVLLIGEQAEKIRQSLEKTGFTAYEHGGSTMSEIVSNARRVAQPGDVVLLSTACASFGLFKDYKDRGDQFKSAVQALA